MGQSETLAARTAPAYTSADVRRARLIAAAVVAGATLAAITVVVSHREWRLYRYVDYGGDGHIWFVPVREHPRWAPVAAVAVLCIGVAVVLWLVPQWRQQVRRLVRGVASPS